MISESKDIDYIWVKDESPLDVKVTYKHFINEYFSVKQVLLPGLLCKRDSFIID